MPSTLFCLLVAAAIATETVPWHLDRIDQSKLPVLRKYYIRTVGSGLARIPPVDGAIGKPVRRRYWGHAATSSFLVLRAPPLTA
jgi:hypothetical protein